MPQLLTLDEFCAVLPVWYEASTRNEYWEGWRELLDRLPAKVDQLGYLEVRDLCDIADWGGNQHGVKQRMTSANFPDGVRRATRLAVSHMDDPGAAMRAIAGVKHWGIAYGSKTLTFMRPTDHAILDSWIRRALTHVIPAIADGNVSSVVKGYVAYIDWCQAAQGRVAEPPPVATAGGRWRIADIGQGLFEFARSGGFLLPP